MLINVIHAKEKKIIVRIAKEIGLVHQSVYVLIILLMITNAYEHRGTIESGTTISRIDDALDGLLWDYFAGRVL